MRHNLHLTRNAHVRAAWLMLCCALLAACQLPALSGAPAAPAAPAAPDSDLVSALLAATPTPDALADSARATLETSLASAAAGTTRFGGSTGSAGAPAAAPPLALQDAVATSVAATLTAQPTLTPNATATAAAYAAQLAAAVAATLTAQPTATPTATPTNTPTPTPSDTPSPTPSPTPTATPSNTPSPTPSDTPSPTPSRTPRPTDTPTHTPRPTPIPAPRAWGFRSCASPCLPDGANATQSIPGPAYKVHATWHYENIPPGAHYQRIWSMPDLGEWVRYDCAWDGPTAGMDSVALSEPMGLRAGWWQVRIVVDDREILNENVLVEGSQTYWEPVGVLWKCRGNK